MHISTARNSTFANVKYARYLPLAPLSCLATYLNEIRLAMDAIKVPSPPLPTNCNLQLTIASQLYSLPTCSLRCFCGRYASFMTLLSGL